MRKLFVTCALVIAAIIIAPGSASAQATGDVDVAITVNGFVILYYYDDIAITIPSDVMAEALGADTTGGIGDPGFAATAVTSSGSGTMTAENATPPTSSNPGLTPVTLTIQNAWSIRGLVNTSVTVDVIGFNDLTSGGSGDIVVTGGACNGTCTGLSPSLGAALSGGVDLNLDFQGITAADTFASTATYTVRATIL